jgi:hypothetical protein
VGIGNLSRRRRATYIGEQAREGMNLDVTVNAPQVVTVAVKVAVEGAVIM